MKNIFNRRMTEVWHYPKVCKYEDHIDNVNEYLQLLNVKADSKDVLLYIHIPFCDSMCFYCAYYKEPIRKYKESQIEDFVLACQKEIQNYSKFKYFRDTNIKCIQFGGGTPTSINPKYIKLILDTIRTHFNMDCDIISIEGNALNLKDEWKLKALNDLGINRVSFGVQTFKEDLRKKLKIKANIQDIYDTINSIDKVGLEEYSIDIMYNLPEQDMDDLEKDLHSVNKLNSTYIDVYSLNVFPNTKFSQIIEKGSYFLSKPTHKKNIEMTRYLNQYFLDNNYNQVMVNTFSKYKNKPPITLDLFLNGSNVIGIGPSAIGYLSGYIYRNVISIKDYIQSVKINGYGIECGNIATPEEQIERKLVFIPNYTFIKRSEIGTIRHEGIIKYLINIGYAIDDGEYIRLTKEGKLWPGNISLLFFSDEQRKKHDVSMMNSLKFKDNPYNQDKMGVPRKYAKKGGK